MSKREDKTFEELKEEKEMCLTERLHIHFTTWEAFERAVSDARNNYGDKFIHGEIVVELR